MMDRIDKLRTIMSGSGIGNILVVSPENLYYYSGFSGKEAYLLVTDEASYIFSDPRYEEQIKSEAAVHEPVIISGQLEKGMAEFIHKNIKQDVYFEPFLQYGSYKIISGSLDGIGFFASPVTADGPREIKEPAELEAVKKACGITDDAFADILKLVRPGISERELAAEFEYRIRMGGAQGAAFDTTIASGKRSSLPHGTASEKIIEDGDTVVFDLGARYGYYCSDLTRTVFLGRCSKEQRKAYETVAEAQAEALSFITAGAACTDADKTARDIIARNGYEGLFRHGLGHGLGLEIHEKPRLSPFTEKKEVFKQGMVFTVEPGIYMENSFGIRIEDTVALTEDGIDVFTKSGKEIIIL